MTATDHRWAIAALAVVALSLGVAVSGMQHAPDQWMRMANLPATQDAGPTALAAGRDAGVPVDALQLADEDAAVVNAIYEIHEMDGASGVSPLRM